MKLLPLLAIAVALLAQSARKATPPNPGGYGTLTFDDEFNGGQLDLSLWSPHDPWNQTRDRQLQPAVLGEQGPQLGDGLFV